MPKETSPAHPAPRRHTTYMNSPIGWIRLEATDTAICRAEWVAAPEEENPEAPTPLLQEAVRQLTAYFAGELTTFDLPLSPEGTPFQQRVWQELRRIPYGEQISYAELARRTGNPNASRAVGSANGKNPIFILIPCHRVIQSGGHIGGYAYGSAMKAFLLKLEMQKSDARQPDSRKFFR